MITSSRFSPSSSPTWYRATLYRPPPTTLLQPFCNNDDQNLSGERQFRSKKISNSSVFDGMVAASRYPQAQGRAPRHIVVVIKYVPSIGNSKRTIEEYFSEIFCGGHSVVNIFNECEDSLITTALIIDSSILAEFLARVKHRNVDPANCKLFHLVLSLLSYRQARYVYSPVFPSLLVCMLMRLVRCRQQGHVDGLPWP
ncbi:hypothetical protein FA15DRAFT_604430 [Coprinopsis marcescibilis]|uniref:inositol-3-phosphate synthase n=1 Tax=Coprinopsis marcescibilis TaxID=230819 RepID=A0A5C3KCR4_COPMA|nr:hypothetical protein FA15DRAFT_604430 [Coprinopsis marcescibilis]